MKLRTSKVVFTEDTHTYKIDGKELIGVTTLMKKHLFANKYDNIPEHILQQAAERGSKIHGLCQMYHVLEVVDAEFQEVANYVELLKANNIEIQATEYPVSDNENFATMIDCVGSDCSLFDIKTTATLDKEYLSWQLSIGALLFEKQNPSVKVPKLYGIWLRGEKAELVEVPRIESVHIHELFNAEIYDRTYENPFKQEANDSINSLVEIESNITELKAAISELEAKKATHLDKISKQMNASGMKKMDTEHITITLVSDRVGKRFDSAKFKAENAELYEKYQKESTTKGHIKIKLK